MVKYLTFRNLPAPLTEIPGDVPLVSPRPGRRGISKQPPSVGSDKDLEMMDELKELCAIKLKTPSSDWPARFAEKYDLIPNMNSLDPWIVNTDASPGPPLYVYGSIVHKDHPHGLIKPLTNWLAENQYLPLIFGQVASNAVPFVELLHVQTSIAEAVNTAMQECFDAKYFWMHPRPSEKSSKVFWQYPEPNHPAYPAGHGTFAGAIYAGIAHYYPHINSLSNIRRQLSTFAHFRCASFMHTPIENIEGFRIGEIIAADYLKNKSQIQYDKEQ